MIFVYANNLYITNTRFKQSKINRIWTWESPDGKTHNQIDYIIISKKWAGSVQYSRAFPSADCSSDHQLVLAGIKLKLKRKKVSTKTRKTDTGRLKDELTNTEYIDTIERRWHTHLNEFFVSVDKEWASIRDVFHETGKQVLGRKICDRKREWLSDDTRRLMEERRVAKSKRGSSSIMTKHHNYLCRRVKESATTDREEFIKGICQEVESARMQNKTRAVYEGIRKITGKHASQVKSVKDAFGKILTDPIEVKHRWKEYFDKLYNDPNVVMGEVLNEFPAAANKEPIPSVGEEEVLAAIKRMKSGKAPGIDNITVKEIRSATHGLGLKAMHHLYSTIWVREELPCEWKRAVIVPLHKKKDKLDCANYRGISLLCQSSKIFSSIIMQRIKARTEEKLSEAQAGFRRDRSTIDQIFTHRQLAEKYEEFGKELYVCYIDFRKAFDSIWRKGLWNVMRHLGNPEKIIKILENAYKNTFSAVRVDGDISDWFETIVGVLQGCVLSPLAVQHLSGNADCTGVG